MELKRIKIGDVIVQRRQKNDGGNYPIVGVSREGFIKPKQVEADTSIYNLFYMKDFVFNPARMELNSIVFNSKYEKAICSSLYEIFYVTKTDVIIPEYLALIVKTDWFTRYCDFLGNGSAREYCRVANISEMEIEIPDLETQKQIINNFGFIEQRKQCLQDLILKIKHVKNIYFDNLLNDFERRFGEPNSCFNEYVELIGSGDWGNEELIGNTDTPSLCIRGADLDNLTIGRIDDVPKRFLLKRNVITKQLDEKNLIVEMSGGSPTQSTGRIAMVNNEVLEQTDLPLLCCNFCRPLIVKKGFEHYFLAYWQHLFNKKTMFKYENSTTGLKNFRLEEFLIEEPIYKAPLDEIDKIESILSVFDNRLSQLGREASLLDRLLLLLKDRLV